MFNQRNNFKNNQLELGQTRLEESGLQEGGKKKAIETIYFKAFVLKVPCEIDYRPDSTHFQLECLWLVTSQFVLQKSNHSLVSEHTNHHSFSVDVVAMSTVNSGCEKEQDFSR